MPTRTLHEDDAPADHDRGRSARHPKEIPAKGWRDIFARVRTEIGSDHVTLVSAGLAMYALLAVFPALTAAIAIYGIFASPASVIQHMQLFSGILPPGTWDLFNRQLQTLAGQAHGSLSVAAGVGVLVALWGARSGMSALMVATNIAYAESEKRGFIKQTLLSLAFTLGAILAFLLVLAIGVVLPVTLAVLGTNVWAQWIVAALRWHWVLWGSAIGAALWIIVSVGFAFYVRSFATYGKTYGALGGVIVLLMWFYLSSLTVVIGAEINAEMERQTKRDTTEGAEKPLGQRGAFAADTVGPPAEKAKSAKQEEQAQGAPAISERGRKGR